MVLGGIKDLKVKMQDDVATVELDLPKEATVELAKQTKELTGAELKFVAPPKEVKK